MQDDGLQKVKKSTLIEPTITILLCVFSCILGRMQRVKIMKEINISSDYRVLYECVNVY